MLLKKGDASCVKMIDFGLSKDFSGLDTMHTMSGSVSHTTLKLTFSAILHCARSFLAKLQLQNRCLVSRRCPLHHALGQSALPRKLRA